MENRLARYLLKGFDLHDDPLLKRRLLLTSSLLFVGLSSFVAFFFVNIFSQNYTIAIIDAVLIGIMLISLYILYFRKNIKLASELAVYFVAVVFILIPFVDDNKTFTLAWSFAFSFLSIPLIGAKKGLKVALLFYFVLFSMAFVNLGIWVHGHWDLPSFFRFIASSMLVLYVTYLNEKSYLKTMNVLAIMHKKEKAYIKELKQLSITDQLTGLYNRRYFDMLYQTEFQKVARYQENVCLIIADIDLFKSVNDGYGHLVGDKVLQALSKLFKENIRSVDVLARWGGEEFIFLLTKTDSKNAIEIAEKIRKKVTNLKIDGIVPITVSFGVSQVYLANDTQLNAIARADKALYQAKQQGRNRVVFAGDLESH